MKVTIAMTTISLDPLDLAALLCSRVCHDVISPVGAIVNGLEVLEDEKEQGMRDIALDLIKKSARAASARLQFCRLAFGAAGSAGASIDTGDAEGVTRSLIVNEKISLEWLAARQLLPKNKVKLLLNLCLIAAATVPRGGKISVDVIGQGDDAVLRVSSRGPNAKLHSGVADLLAGRPEAGRVDAHSIQPYYAGLVARECGLEVNVLVESDGIGLTAVSSAAVAAA